ncbi:hypothetical protein BDGGKGIB_00308 [Nodularia sphaerocarpa UHCC 0038]|nr:hypothetical protein BDGGKGIB_00308 [Nodularia sphaerocarpa UHCC 0038]
MVRIGISFAWREDEVRRAGAILLLLTSPLVPLLQGATMYTHLGNQVQSLNLPPLIPPWQGGKIGFSPLLS